MEPLLLRVEDLRPIVPELFEAGELVLVVGETVEIATLEEAATSLREARDVRH
jgi:hypothetical protein